MIWPSQIVRNFNRAVYLDLNVWVGLSRARLGHSDQPEYVDLLLEVRKTISCGKAIFPISDTHYFEISAIRDPRQRADLADVISELSGFAVLLGRPTIARLEIDAVLDHLHSSAPSTDRIPLVGTSGLWAFGRKGGVRVIDLNDRDVTDECREDAWITVAAKKAERLLLAGPTDAQAVHLRATTEYAPELAQATTERRAEQEREQAARFDSDPKWRKGRLRDAIAARELMMEWGDALGEALRARGTTVGAVVDESREGIRQLADGMPSNRTAISIKTQYHRDGRKQWLVNDINDIDALAIAVPYCDAVLTDHAARQALVNAGADQDFNTALPEGAADLVTWLRELPP